MEEIFFEKVIKHLLGEDKSRSWKILENIALYSSNFDLLSKSVIEEIPLLRALEFHLEEKFLLKLVSRLHWKKMEDALDKLLKKSLWKMASKIVIKKGNDRTIMEPPIAIATKLVISTG